jgi:hypothetical protein
MLFRVPEAVRECHRGANRNGGAFARWARIWPRPTDRPGPLSRASCTNHASEHRERLFAWAVSGVAGHADQPPASLISGNGDCRRVSSSRCATVSQGTSASTAFQVRRGIVTRRQFDEVEHQEEVDDEWEPNGVSDNNEERIAVLTTSCRIYEVVETLYR